MLTHSLWTLPAANVVMINLIFFVLVLNGGKSEVFKEALISC